MRNFWLVAKYEFSRTVLRRGFIIATLLVPIGMALIIFLVYLVETMSQNSSAIGYVDIPNMFDPALQTDLPEAEDRVGIVEYDNEESAHSALENGEIQAYFVFPENYPDSLETDIHYTKDPPRNDVWREFDDFVRMNLLTQLSEEEVQRLLEGPNITVIDTSSGREFSESAIINIILPFAGTFFFLFATMMAAGYLMGVVASEKENRTMEIVISSVTPGQLIAGKAMGLLAGAVLQLTVYIIAIGIGLRIARPYVEILQYVEIPWGYLGLMIVFFIPAYTFVASIMIAIGGAVTESQQGQQVAGILNLFFMLPIFFLPVLFTDSGHPFVVLMTFFPTTSFLTISLRWGLGSIPVWQMVVSWIILVASTVVMLWAAVRVFRAGMLRYGQNLTVKGVVASLKG